MSPYRVPVVRCSGPKRLSEHLSLPSPVGAASTLFFHALLEAWFRNDSDWRAGYDSLKR